MSICKNPGEKLGMSIKGGVKNYPGDESSDEGIFISRVCSTVYYFSHPQNENNNSSLSLCVAKIFV